LHQRPQHFLVDVEEASGLCHRQAVSLHLNSVSMKLAAGHIAVKCGTRRNSPRFRFLRWQLS
jgi:hypothetical protein